MGVRIEVVDVSGAMVVAPVGDVDLTSAPSLLSQLQRAAADGDQQVICCDLTRTDFLDSSGLSALVAAHHLAQEYGRDFWVVGPNDGVRRKMELTLLNELLTCLPTMAAVRAELDRR